MNDTNKTRPMPQTKKAPGTFLADVTCDCCGPQGRHELPIASLCVHMHDGRRVIPANGSVRCPNDRKHAATYHRTTANA